MTDVVVARESDSMAGDENVNAEGDKVDRR